MDKQIERFNNKSIADREIDELIGLCRGVMADGHVCEAEARFILTWLEQQVNDLTKYPFNILYQRISAMMEDDVLDNDEQLELIELVISIIGNPTQRKADSDGRQSVSAPAMPYTEHKPTMLTGLVICLTGEFEMGKRAEIAATLESKGAIFSKGVSQKINVLFIGAVGNTSWKHSSFGRKIEKVMDLNDSKGLDIAILGEEHLVPLI